LSQEGKQKKREKKLGFGLEIQIWKIFLRICEIEFVVVG
jgi:hypothetical protein